MITAAGTDKMGVLEKGIEMGGIALRAFDEQFGKHQ
jgi:hypothetical protein